MSVETERIRKTLFHDQKDHMSTFASTVCGEVSMLRLVSGSLEISAEKLASGLSWLATSLKAV